MAETDSTKLYAVRVQAGREEATADMLVMRARRKVKEEGIETGLKAVIAPEELRGYVIIEVEELTDELRDLIHDLPDTRGIVEKPMDFEEIEHYFAPKPEAVEISEGDVVEILSGPFKGEKARVVSVDESRHEITVELLEAPVPIPVTVKMDALRLLREEEYEG
ncbi:transcription elongation factor Spt5 [Methanopyrus sp. KOL6]|uniref:transcription elongation factor Spt5 n=1 Tax=Methanopyrus sp. KOL6 TaxID=1937004 RepID=UPI000B4BAB4B|nr:transcription elongation factor Spt5 [Methanopyrus sp. KOL6]